jgi:hypothetical protein
MQREMCVGEVYAAMVGERMNKKNLTHTMVTRLTSPNSSAVSDVIRSAMSGTSENSVLRRKMPGGAYGKRRDDW